MLPLTMAMHKVKKWLPVISLATAHPDGPVEVWVGGPRFASQLALEPGFWRAADMPGRVPRVYDRVQPSETPVGKWILHTMRFTHSKKLAGYCCPCGFRLWGPEPDE